MENEGENDERNRAYEFGLGSCSKLWILVKMAATSYVGLHLFCRISKHSSPLAYTLGWTILERNLTVGGLFGYDSSKVSTNRNVPSSKGVSAEESVWEKRDHQHATQSKSKGSDRLYLIPPFPFSAHCLGRWKQREEQRTRSKDDSVPHHEVVRARRTADTSWGIGS